VLVFGVPRCLEISGRPSYISRRSSRPPWTGVASLGGDRADREQIGDPLEVPAFDPLGVGKDEGAATAVLGVHPDAQVPVGLEDGGGEQDEQLPDEPCGSGASPPFVDDGELGQALVAASAEVGEVSGGDARLHASAGPLLLDHARHPLRRSCARSRPVRFRTSGFLECGQSQLECQAGPARRETVRRLPGRVAATAWRRVGAGPSPP